MCPCVFPNLSIIQAKTRRLSSDYVTPESADVYFLTNIAAAKKNISSSPAREVFISETLQVLAGIGHL